MPPPPKKRRVEKPPKGYKNTSHVTNGADKQLDTAFSKAAEWDLEQDYEQHARFKTVKDSTRLPIKRNGRIEEAPAVAQEDEDPYTDSSSDPEGIDSGVTLPAEPSPAKPARPRLSSREELLQTQEELARIAGLLNEAPEDHIGSLKTLAEITNTASEPVLAELGLATQLVVFKDLIPGYRIRPLGDEDAKSKVSKDVRRQRQFEQSIVRGYQSYVQALGRLAGQRRELSTSGERGLANVAIFCAAGLIEAVPHFNFREDVLRILVNEIGRRQVTKEFETARKALETLFENDEEGNASLEAVAMMSKMMKIKAYDVREEVVNMFLRLRLLSELVVKGSDSKIDKSEQETTKVKSKKVKLGKKEKKAAKERKAIEKEMKEADAQVSYEERDKNQSETLKIVFSIYLRILKARVPDLMGPVLEGLVKYARLINQEFFGDLLEALRELILESEQPPALTESEEGASIVGEVAHGAPRNATRESLLCVITAFALLQGQDASAAASTLHLDLDFFVQHLYRTLYPASLNADIEFSDKTPRLADPYAPASERYERTKVNVQTTIVLLLRSLQAVLVPPQNPRAVPPVRLAAFVHHIMTSSLQLPEKSATAMLGLLNQTAKQHKKKIAALWNTEERRGDGTYDALSADIEAGNPFAGTVWQGELLRLHYAPPVRTGVTNLESMLR